MEPQFCEAITKFPCYFIYMILNISLHLLYVQVSHRQPEEITFRIHQKLKVGVLQPAAVSVYEHNNQQNSKN